MHVLAELALREGNAAGALTLFRQSEAEHTTIDSGHRAALARAGCGRALIALNDRVAARIELSAAVATLREHEFEAAAMEVMRVLQAL